MVSRTMATHLFTIPKHIRYFYNERTAQWIPMTLQAESEIPQVSAMIDKIQEYVPSWRDRLSILQAIRDADWDLNQVLVNYSVAKRGDAMSLEDIAGRYLNENDAILMGQIQASLPNSITYPDERGENGGSGKHYASSQIKARDDLLTQYRSKILSLENTISSLSTNLTSATSAIQSLNTQITSLQSTISSNKSHNTHTESSLNTANNTIATLQEKIQELNDVIEALKTKNADLIYDQQDLLVREKEKKLEVLAGCLSRTQKELEEARGRSWEKGGRQVLVALAGEVKRLKSELTSLRSLVTTNLDATPTHISSLLQPLTTKLLQTHQSYLDLLNSYRSESLRRRLLSDT
ncbi:hypothetical protein HK102_006393, partial [Quaeritorhiza haematococci]